ncbi:transglutaminase-like domain-containing protein [Flavobacteriales bacterium]|nr:transglutaminase-like domain-containing protein [Flavobacteriales bacterium]
MESYKPLHLESTYYLDSNNPEIVAFAKESIGNTGSDKEKAVKLYYAVRDGFRYNPYDLHIEPSKMRASALLKAGEGHCIDKAIFLAACARAVGIPSRLEFADVKNHISTQKLIDTLKSDVFAMHGIAQLFIDGKWVKCTPAFNKGLCILFDVEPLEFDGENDSLFHEFDKKNNKFMEYVGQHGTFDDFPREYFIGVMIYNYPHIFPYQKIREAYVELQTPSSVDA